jgi:endonuclease YncB( thermonuclease family)
MAFLRLFDGNNGVTWHGRETEIPGRMGLIEDLHTAARRRRRQLQRTRRPQPYLTRAVFRSAILVAALGCLPANAACTFDVLKQGRVAAIIDARTFKLADGQEVRLAGIELADPSPPSLKETTALEQMLRDRDVTLRGPSAKPDRYGRLVALAFAGDGSNSIQGQLIDQGTAIFSGNVAESDNKDCALDLLAHEAAARRNRRGVWSEAAAIKNTERPGDILLWIGQFVVAEGKIASVREAGGTIYVNFGRRWTEGFAVTISRRMIRRFDAWGIALKTLENRTVRVRGFVEQRTGPRIEALGPGQIELVGDNR